jgi:cell division transport system permease protein
MRTHFIASEIAIGLRRNLTMTIAVIMTVTVSLLFLGVGILTYKQVGLSKGFWYDQIELSVYLCGKDSTGPGCASGEVTGEQREKIGQLLQDNPEVEEVTYESKQRAFENFRLQFKDSALAESTTVDQLPESFRVKLKDPERYEVVASQFRGAQGVENVIDLRDYLDKLFAVLNGFLAGAVILASLTLVTAALQIFNTIRLAAFSRRPRDRHHAARRCIQLLHPAAVHPGGHHCALLGTGLAFGLLALGFNWVVPYAQRYIRITPYIESGSLWQALFWMALTGVSIAAMASYLTLRRYLRV